MKENACNIRRYNPATDRELWDASVKASRNGTFLVLRDYMDYHADRFEDLSLIAELRGHTALLPASVIRLPDGTRELHSHPGLTYGGWILPADKLDGNDLLTIYKTTIALLRDNNFNALVIKPVPYIYHSRPSQEEEYALWRCGATQSAVNLASVIDRRGFAGFDYMHRRYLPRVSRENPQILRLSADRLHLFHTMLSTCLSDRYDATPVHSLEELQRLMKLFPEHIQVYTLIDAEGEVQAGVCLYITSQVVRCQYIACTDEGRRRKYLSWLFQHLIELFPQVPYFDFGTSNEAGGTILNPTLHTFKFGHGAGSVIYPTYRISPL